MGAQAAVSVFGCRRFMTPEIRLPDTPLISGGRAPARRSVARLRHGR